MKNLKTFSRVKLAENYTHGRIFEKNYSKKVKDSKFGQKRSIFGQNGQKLGFSQNGPDSRISDQVFWIQHSIWVQELQKLQTRPSVKLKY